MWVSRLETLFSDARRDALQGYGTLGSRPIGGEGRHIHFEKLSATIEQIPELLRFQAAHAFDQNEFWRARQAKDLCERVGRDFFPDTAAEFTWRLMGQFQRMPIPDDFTRRAMNRHRRNHEPHRPS